MTQKTGSAPDSALIPQAMERHGPGLLLSAGLLLHRAEVTPTLACLRQDPDPQMIAAKFMRLEGYRHAACRTRISQDGGRWDCTRESRGTAAGLGQNCLIAGALMGLLKDTGHGNIAVTIGGRRIEARDVLRAGLPAGETGTSFTITWTGRDLPLPAPEPDSPELSAHLAALLAEGLSFSEVMRQTRMKEAARLLADPAVSLAETGYCCGYADQAHFQRDFRRAMGMTPTRFREIGAVIA